MRQFLTATSPLTIFLLLLALAYLVDPARRVSSELLRRIWLSVVFAELIYFVGISIFYAFSPSFIDHIEPSVLMYSLQVSHGGSPYLPLSDGTALCLPYGLWAFLPSAIASLLLPPVVASKLTAVLMSLGATALVLWSLRRKCGSGPMIVGAWLYLAFCLPFENTAFWNRPESLMLLGGTLLVTALSLKGKRAAMITSAIGLGILCGAKVTGIFYAAPLLVALHHHHNWRPVGIVILAGAVIATAPFPLLQISFRDYMAAVLVLSLHEFEWTLILRTGSLLAVMLWLLWYMRARDRGASDHDSIVLRNGLIAFAIAGFVIVIMAGKQGAGPHFLVPLAPSAAWLSTRMWQRFRSNADWEHQFDRGLVRLMAAMTLVLVIGIGESQGRVVKGLGKPNSEAVNAIEVLSQRFVGRRLLWAFADGDSYRESWLRPQLGEVNSACLAFEPPALMDRLAAGYPMPDTLAKMIADTVFAIIIVPTNSSPFSMTSWYHPRGRLFTDKLIDAFHTHYRRIEDGPLFSIWRPAILLDSTSQTPETSK